MALNAGRPAQSASEIGFAYACWATEEDIMGFLDIHLNPYENLRDLLPEKITQRNILK